MKTKWFWDLLGKKDLLSTVRSLFNIEFNSKSSKRLKISDYSVKSMKISFSEDFYKAPFYSRRQHFT